MTDLKIDYAELDAALREAANEDAVIRAAALRRVSRKLYDRLARDRFDWRSYARSRGYQTKTRVPRGHWNQPETLIEIIREVARDKGAPIIRDLTSNRLSLTRKSLPPTLLNKRVSAGV